MLSGAAGIPSMAALSITRNCLGPGLVTITRTGPGGVTPAKKASPSVEAQCPTS